ncbi:hypothetical protein F5Y06DRAFT_151083 [Hypoxylon sp. FL0890]|nr:hypothetical protein F5Y06DRAFT_151083 [Hypoxylon sp. FL0890]
MSDYASLKVPELKKLLQEKSLPVTGNKADLIARLQEHDKSKDPAPARENEDEIDYSDDEVPTTTKPAEPAKPVESAEPIEPAPAPAEEKPAEPSEPVKDETAPAAAAEKPAEAATEAAADEATKAEAPKQDFSAHLPASKADEEARKRAERAKRFGIVENDEEKKKAARAERFGVDQSSLTTGLDAALPEKRPPKRGREGGNNDGERGAKRQNPGGRHRGKGRFRHGGGGRQGGAPRKEGKPAGAKGQSGILNDPTEKAKAEARAKRFGGGS